MIQLILALPMLGSPPPQPLAFQDPAIEETTKQDPSDRFEELIDEQNTIVEEWRAEAAKPRKPQTEGGSVPAMRMRPDFSTLIPKFEAAATDYVGTDDAVQFLSWILQQGPGESGANALATLTKSHAGSEMIADLGRMLPYLSRIVDEEAADAFIAAVKKDNKNADVLGWIAIMELETTIKEADRESDEYQDARTTLANCADKAKNNELKDMIKGAIDLREKFGKGCTAPDIAGTDLDGTEFKLSDYKGKVIFLDFWGDW
ncbi:MAG: hypothetical protein ACI841_004945 [Planctomycetota bacterium]|jgi:hypothetical protein